jgi:hypothetical protein
MCSKVSELGVARRGRTSRLISVTTALAMVVTIFTPLMTATSMAVTLSSGDYDYQLIDSDTEVEITGYHGTGGDVGIPEKIDGLPVTSIGDYAFNSWYSVTSAIIPSGVTSIGAGAFSYCGLTSVSIPESVISIGDYAFSGCTDLSSATISDGVISMGMGSFSGCSLISVSIPKSVSSIGVQSLSCTSLQTIEVNENNEKYASIDGILYDKDGTTLMQFPCAKDGPFVIPDGVKTLADLAFAGSALTSVIIPGSITSMGGSVFSRCSALVSVTIQDGVKTIGIGAFIDCTVLVSVTIPKSVTIIEMEAFMGCSSLKSITIPSSVTTIGLGAFWGCGLTSVTIPGSVETIEAYAFLACIGLTSVIMSNGVQNIGYGAFSSCLTLKTVVMPGSITTIGSGAFYECTSLKSVTIPPGVRNIGVNAFGTCSSLTSINVSPRNSIYSSVDGVLYNKEKTTLIQFPCGRGGSFVIPACVRTIGESAFYVCSNLNSVIIPGTVRTISNDAFASCTALKSVTIWDGVRTIGSGAFTGCDALPSITIPGSVYAIGAGTFLDCDSLESVKILDGVKEIESGTFCFCWSLKSVTMPKSITSIGDTAFYDCPSLESITMPRSVTSVGALAFAECGSLRQIFFEGDAPSYIGDGWVDDHNVALTIYYLQGATGFTNPWHDLPTVGLTKKSVISMLRSTVQTAIDDLTGMINDLNFAGIHHVISEVQTIKNVIDFAADDRLFTRDQSQSLQIWVQAALKSLNDASSNLGIDPLSKTINELKTAKYQLNALLLKINIIK